MLQSDGFHGFHRDGDAFFFHVIKHFEHKGLGGGIYFRELFAKYLFYGAFFYGADFAGNVLERTLHLAFMPNLTE